MSSAATPLRARRLCGVALQLRDMFLVDSQVRMTPTGQSTIMSVHTELVAHELHVEVTRMGPMTVHLSHRPAAEQVGPRAWARDREQFPEAMSRDSNAIR